MKGYRRIAYGLLAMAALWVLPIQALAAEETTAGAGEAKVAAARQEDGVAADKKVLTPEEKEQLKREEKERKAQEKREKKEQKAREKREKKHKKKELQKYTIVYEDDTYVYYMDSENLRWRKMPYSDEKILDVWIRLIPIADAARAETIEAAGDLYMGHYYLEHYYMRRTQRQIQFLAELEVTGRPQNDVATGKYSAAAWEELVPGSVEDSLYNRIMRKMSNPKDKATSTSLTDFLEDVLRISL